MVLFVNSVMNKLANVQNNNKSLQEKIILFH